MTENHVGSKDASVVAPGRLVLLRHGQTVWSESGQHTGRTDIPLTDTGRLQAESAGERLRSAFPNGFDPGCMFASPLRRARQTAALAGYGDYRILPEIAEWDYGRAEGRTRQQVSEASGFAWDVWRDGPRSLNPGLEGDWIETLPSGEQVPVHNGPGEDVESRRAYPGRHRTSIAVAERRPRCAAGGSCAYSAHPYFAMVGRRPAFRSSAAARYRALLHPEPVQG